MHADLEKLKLRPFNENEPLKIVFVCLGNICRSPTAEGVFQHIVNKKGSSSLFEIDSAGTAAYHEGEAANSKSRQVAKLYGVDLLSRARKVHPDDFEYYDLLLAMDRSNYQDLLRDRAAVQYAHKIHLFRIFDPEAHDKHPEVPDPYYGGLQGFDDVFQMVQRTSEKLYEFLMQFHQTHAS